MAGHITADGYTELGIGLISVGWMGKLHSRAYQAIPLVYPELKIRPRLVHAADTAPDRVDYARDVLGYAKGSTDYRAVLADPAHRSHSLYAAVRERVTGVCSFCAAAFGVREAVQANGVPLLDEYAHHPSLRTLLAEGFQVLTF